MSCVLRCLLHVLCCRLLCLVCFAGCTHLPELLHHLWELSRSCWVATLGLGRRQSVSESKSCMWIAAWHSCLACAWVLQFPMSRVSGACCLWWVLAGVGSWCCAGGSLTCSSPIGPWFDAHSLLCSALGIHRVASGQMLAGMVSTGGCPVSTCPSDMACVAATYSHVCTIVFRAVVAHVPFHPTSANHVCRTSTWCRC